MNQIQVLRDALSALVASLSEHDDEGMIEHAQQMIDARAALDATKVAATILPVAGADELPAQQASEPAGAAMYRFTKKPVTIEALQFQRRNNGPVPYPEWFDDAVTRNDITTFNTGKWGDATEPAHCEIKTLEGVMRADESDWIIRGVKGEIYPCKADIFELTYGPAPESVRDALNFAAETIELFDDKTMESDYMLDSGDCAKIIRALPDYLALRSQPEQQQVANLLAHKGNGNE